MPASAPPVVIKKSRRDSSKAPALFLLVIDALLFVAATWLSTFNERSWRAP
jgi:hypothetical protein